MLEFLHIFRDPGYDDSDILSGVCRLRTNWHGPVHHDSVDVAKEADILEWYVDGVEPLEWSQNLEGSPEGVAPEGKKREEEQSQDESRDVEEGHRGPSLGQAAAARVVVVYEEWRGHEGVDDLVRHSDSGIGYARERKPEVEV